MTIQFSSIAHCGFSMAELVGLEQSCWKWCSPVFSGVLGVVMLKLWGLLYTLVCFAADLLSRIKLPMGSHNPACIDFSEQLLCFSALEGPIHLFN